MTDPAPNDHATCSHCGESSPRRYLIPHRDGFLHPRCEKELIKQRDEMHVPAVKIFRQALSLCIKAWKPLIAISLAYILCDILTDAIFGGSYRFVWLDWGIDCLLSYAFLPGLLVAIDAAAANKPLGLAKSMSAIATFGMKSAVSGIPALGIPIIGISIFGTLLPIVLVAYVPAIYLVVRWGLAAPFITFDAAGPINALRLSWRATENRFFKLFIPLVLPLLVFWVLSSVVHPSLGLLHWTMPLQVPLSESIQLLMDAVYGTFATAVTYIVYHQEIKRMDARS